MAGVVRCMKELSRRSWLFVIIEEYANNLILQVLCLMSVWYISGSKAVSLSSLNRLKAKLPF